MLSDKKVLISLSNGMPKEYAVDLSLTIDDEYILRGQLIDQKGNPLGTEQSIDLPLESMIINGSYNDETKKVVLTLQNGNTIEFSIADLVSGLVPDSRTIAGVDLENDITKSELLTALNVADGAQVNTVDSVNGQTGVIVLDADDISDSSTDNKFVSSTDITNWNGKSVVSVSDTGTATDEVGYITINGVEKKLKSVEYPTETEIKSILWG